MYSIFSKHPRNLGMTLPSNALKLKPRYPWDLSLTRVKAAGFVRIRCENCFCVILPQPFLAIPNSCFLCMTIVDRRASGTSRLFSTAINKSFLYPIPSNSRIRYRIPLHDVTAQDEANVRRRSWWTVQSARRLFWIFRSPNSAHHKKRQWSKISRTCTSRCSEHSRNWHLIQKLTIK